MALKARNLTGGNKFESNIDWKAIGDQVEEGTSSARISQVIDLGCHTEEKALGDKGFTGFEYKEDAEAWLEEMASTYKSHKAFKNGARPEIEDANDTDFDSKKHKTYLLEDDGTWTESDSEPDFVVALNEFGGVREYQELAIVVDLVENPVDYGEEIGEKFYRLMLNSSFKGQLKGFPLKKCPPQKDGDSWTVKSNSKLYEIASAVRLKEELLQVDLEDADWSLLAGKGLNVTVNKEGDEGQYIKAGKCVALKVRKGEVEEIPELEGEALVISFDDVTVDMLREAHLRKSVIDKIKSANDYAGSAMERAIKKLEAEAKAKAKSESKSKDNDNDSDSDVDEDEAPVNAKVKPVKEKPAKTKPAKEKPVKTKETKGSEDDEGSDDNNDTDPDDWSE